MPNTQNYPSEVFKLILMSELSIQEFEYHPIWSEYYDYDERDEIVSWGVDRNWLDAELKRMDTGGEHCAYPILRPYPLPCRMRLFIKARFVTAGGATLEGCVMNDNAGNVTVFAADEQFTFTGHPGLADLNGLSLRELKIVIELGDDPVFPLRFETDFLDTNNRLIAGSFTAGSMP